MINMMPALATITKLGELVELDNGKTFIKYGVVIDDTYLWLTSFGSTAHYINNYAVVGQKMFLDNWNMTKKDLYYDFIATKIQLIRKGEDR
ncbi:MAG: hypothetical protein ACRCX2_14530 [Paraclostridium sp.]